MNEAEIQVRPSKDGQWYYRVVAANGEVLVTSETYTRQADALRGAEALLRAVLEAVAQHPTAFIFTVP